MVHFKLLESKQCFADHSYQSNGSSSFTMELVGKLEGQVVDSGFHQLLHRSFWSWNWSYLPRHSCFCLLASKFGQKLELVTRFGCVSPKEIN